MCGCVIKVIWQCAACRVEAAIGELCLQDARCAGADKNAHPVRSILLCGLVHGIGKTVLDEAQHRKSVVAAVKACKVRRKLHGINIGDLAGKSRKVYRVEGALRQSSPAFTQGGKGFLKSMAQATGHGEI